MQLTLLTILVTCATLITANPVEVHERQRFRGTFPGGGCAIYSTEANPSGPNCGDQCIAEGIRRGCCQQSGFQIVPANCFEGFSACQCTCT
ncbi:hypothetical protein BST61_g2464 [Cercospora zeina]